jgi:hypothetical protein
MARPGPQTQAKRRREQAKKEKRRAKDEKKALRKAEKEGTLDIETETEIAQEGALPESDGPEITQD